MPTFRTTYGTPSWFQRVADLPIYRVENDTPTTRNSLRWDVWDRYSRELVNGAFKTNKISKSRTGKYKDTLNGTLCAKCGHKLSDHSWEEPHTITKPLLSERLCDGFKPRKGGVRRK